MLTFRITKIVFTVMLVCLLGAFHAVPAEAQNILVYTGEGDVVNAAHVQFGVAAGKPVITSLVLEDLSEVDCVILPSNGLFEAGFTFSPATLATLNTYVNAGGRLIAVAEWSMFVGSISAMNGVAANLGADLAIVSSVIDGGFHTTTNIDPSPFTVGVASIRFAATSEVSVAVGPHAHSLVRTTADDGPLRRL